MSPHFPRMLLLAALLGPALTVPTLTAAAVPPAPRPANATASTSAAPDATPEAAQAHDRQLHRAADLYAINDLTHHVVRFDRTGTGYVPGLVGTGWTDPAVVEVSRRGIVWVLDRGPQRLVRVAPGGAQRAVRTLSTSAGLALDRMGNAYFVDDGEVVMISSSGRTATVLGQAPPDTLSLGVDGAGRVIVAAIGEPRPDGDLELWTYPSGGGAPTVRRLRASGPEYLVAPIEVSVDGSVLFRISSPGGSGYTSVGRVAPGGRDVVDVSTRLADYAATFDDRGLLLLTQTRAWCPAASRPECDHDPAVDEVLVYPAAGGPRYGTVPVQGLEDPRGGIAASERGTVFAAEYDGSGRSPLKVVPAGGGTARILIRGSFRSLEVPPGR